MVFYTMEKVFQDALRRFNQVLSGTEYLFSARKPARKLKKVSEWVYEPDWAFQDTDFFRAKKTGNCKATQCDALDLRILLAPELMYNDGS